MDNPRPFDSLLILSGGMDSVTLLYKLIEEGRKVKCLTFNYGQRHGKEIEAAADIAEAATGAWGLANISSLRPIISAGALHRDPVPEGHYAEEAMKATVSPNRNMIFISIAVAHALTLNIPEVYYAAHAGDHTIYPDCRPGFVGAMNDSIREGVSWVDDKSWSPVRLVAPFIHKTKAEIVRLGLALGVPYHLTWSCYNGREVACGRCGTCVERLEAFHLVGAEDPIPYEDREFWKEAVKRG